ncbi:MAG: hypothetical protein CVU05_09725 [Bacteroidetes bacterium HGW-Bacteroidetes-21]|jgi:hypothetical protein|nr:MAG: hypothetical protein CVU05_09725 [Bacteroidetes bacterium HGW-Bacteroidetes-21]
MKYLIVIILLTCTTIAYTPCYCNQEIAVNNKVENDTVKKNSIYIEGLGCGFFGSINYERYFRNNISKNYFSSRIGYSYFPIFSRFHLIPVLINYNISIINSISFEFGLCSRFSFPEYGMKGPSFRNTDILANAGFRFVIRRNLQLKFNYTPTIIPNLIYGGIHGNNLLFFGFSIGSCF